MRIGRDEGGSVTFGPLVPGGIPSEVADYDFLMGPVSVVAPGHPPYLLEDRNGVEALALSCFRADLKRLLSEREGRVFFGDHDFGEIVDLECVDGDVRVRSDLPSHDVWEIEVATLGPADIQATIEDIDRIEAAFGPLLGYCGGCGIPQSAYYS